MDAKLKEYLAKKIEENIELLPEHMRDGIRLYVLEQCEPGGFMTAVLENDLKGAVARADHINKRALTQIVEYCMWTLPSNCWGSPEKVSAWLRPEPEQSDDAGYDAEHPPRVGDFTETE